MRKEVRRDVKTDLRKGLNNRARVLNAEADRDIRRAFNARNLPQDAAMKKFDKEVRKISKDFTGNVKEHIKMQNCLSPQCCDFLDLLDDPFNAKWQNAKYPFYPGGQPLKSTVIRAYGITEFTINPAGTGVQLYWCPNPGFAFDDNSSAVPLEVAQGATRLKGLPGCPPCAAANSWDATVNQSGPHSGYIRKAVALNNIYQFNPTPQDTDEYITWNTVSQLGNDDLTQPGKFAFRVVAAGIRIINEDKEMDLGGLISSACVSRASNFGLEASTLMNQNSSAHYQRGSQALEMHYRRSSDDDRWYYPTSTAKAASTQCDAIRHFITIQPPDAVATPTFSVMTVAFYEIKGVAADAVGTPSFQQPQSAGKVASAMSQLAQLPSGENTKSYPREFRDTVELVNAKEHPALGKMAKDETSKKGFLDRVEDFVGDVIPVAKRVAEVGLALL